MVKEEEVVMLSKAVRAEDVWGGEVPERVWFICGSHGFSCGGGGEYIWVMFSSNQTHHGEDGGVKIAEVEV